MKTLNVKETETIGLNSFELENETWLRGIANAASFKIEDKVNAFVLEMVGIFHKNRSRQLNYRQTCDYLLLFF